MTLSRKFAELIVKKKASVEDMVEILRAYNLLSLLPAIQSAVVKMIEERSFEDVVHIESPFEVSESALARIKRIIGNDLAKTDVTINKNILGGFKARFKGKLYDGSAERIIRQLTH